MAFITKLILKTLTNCLIMCFPPHLISQIDIDTVVDRDKLLERRVKRAYLAVESQ